MKRFALVAVAGLAGFALAVACGDPYDGEIPTAGTEGGADVTSDAIADDDAAIDGGFVEPDAPPPILDATTEKPFVDAAGCTCDCDKDGYRSGNQDPAGCDASTTKLDCDDLDPRAHPDAGFSSEPANVDTKGDWDCNGVTNRQYAVLIKCSDYQQLSGCNNVQGFIGDPACGEAASFVTCKNGPLGTSCLDSVVETKKQGCK